MWERRLCVLVRHCTVSPLAIVLGKASLPGQFDLISTTAETPTSFTTAKNLAGNVQIGGLK